MVLPFCLASTLRVAKLLPSRKWLTSYRMGTARVNIQSVKNAWSPEKAAGIVFQEKAIG